MGGESAEAWRAVLDDLIKRGLRRPEFLIVDGAPGLDKAIAVVWDGRARPAPLRLLYVAIAIAIHVAWNASPARRTN